MSKNVMAAEKIDAQPPKLISYYASEKTDKHWEDFEVAFFGLDPNKPKPERYLAASFSPEEFRYKLAALAYSVIFDPESVPEEVKRRIDQYAQQALANEKVREKMHVLEDCMKEFFEVVKKQQAGGPTNLLPTMP